MPEGDTLFRIATTLRKALAGARVTKFESARLRGSPAGERIVDVAARGKNLLVLFEKRTLRTHLMLHGAWHLYREGERWQRPAFQARVVIHADNGFVAVCFAAPVPSPAWATSSAARRSSPRGRIPSRRCSACATKRFRG